MTGGTPVYAPALYGQGLSVSTTTFTNNLPAASNITTVNGLTASCWINQTAGVLGNNKLNFFNLNSSVNNNNQESLPSGASKNANQLRLTIFFSNGRLAYVYNDYGAGYREYDSGKFPSNNTWYHMCVVVGGGAGPGSTSNTLSFYINGVLDNTTGYTTDMSGTTAYNSVSTAYLTKNTFVINDARVYNTALTAAQVLGIYQSRGIPPSGTLQQVSAPQPSLLWSFNGSNVDSITSLSPSFSNNPPPLYSTGLYGLCYSLPNSAVVSLAPTYSQEYTLALQPPLTISFWFNATTLIRSGTSYISILGLRNNGSSYIDFASNLNGVNDLGMYCRYPNGPPPSDLSFTISTSISINTWYNMCVVFSGTSIQPYLNGVAASSRTFATWNSTLLGIGTSGQFRGHAFAGYVQDLRVYNTALTAAQIQGIYQSQGIPPTGSLT